MVEKKVDTKNSNNIKDFPLSRLAGKWPFSLKLAKDLFHYSSSVDYSSFEEFLVNTWLFYCEENRETSSSSSSSDEDTNDENWPYLKYQGFFIKNGIVFFEETASQKSENIENSTEKDNKVCIYTLEKISYRLLICEATRFYINSFFQGKAVYIEQTGKEKRDLLKFISMHQVWPVIFNYLIFTPYSSYIRRVLEEEKYTITYKIEIIVGFYIESKRIKSYRQTLNRHLGFSNTEIEENVALNKFSVFKERFLNLFASSGLSTNESNKLIDNFFSTKSFNEIASFYENYQKEVTSS